MINRGVEHLFNKYYSQGYAVMSSRPLRRAKYQGHMRFEKLWFMYVAIPEKKMMRRGDVSNCLNLQRKEEVAFFLRQDL